MFKEHFFTIMIIYAWDHQLARQMDLYNKIHWAIFSLPRYFSRVGPLYHIVYSLVQVKTAFYSLSTKQEQKPLKIYSFGGQGERDYHFLLIKYFSGSLKNSWFQRFRWKVESMVDKLVVMTLDSGSDGPGFKSCRGTSIILVHLGKV